MGAVSSRASDNPRSHLEDKSSEVVAPCGKDGGVRRARGFEAELPATFFPTRGANGEPPVFTMVDAFNRGLHVSRDRPCYGYRLRAAEATVTNPDGSRTTKDTFGDFAWFTYAEVDAMIAEVGAGLVAEALAPPNEDGDRFVGLFGKNRWEHAVSQHALFRQSIISTPLYDSLGDHAVCYIVQRTGMHTVLCGVVETRKILGWKASPGHEALASLRNVVQWEDVDDAERAECAAAGLRLLSFAELRERGRAHPVEPATLPTPGTTAMVCFTSGTTGEPKGAILTHGAMVADMGNVFFARADVTGADVYLSYLPMAHVFEGLVQSALIAVGAAVGFYSGDTAAIVDDIKALRPTIFCSVPRLFNRIHDSIRAGVEKQGGIAAALFRRAYADKQAGLRDNYVAHALWDRLVFRGIAAKVGLDRCHLMVTGSAPLAAHVMEFLRIAFACRVLEGYGQTECCGACTATDPDDQASLGHVGAPLASNEIKLVSVPELSYLVTDTAHGRETDETGAVTKPGIACQGRGEICIRGPNIFSGYYRDPARTSETLDAHGWMLTGDIGLWDSRGNLRVIDRKKNFFKLSHGEYVAAEKVETQCSNPWVQQIFIHGDSLHSVLVAVVVPHAHRVTEWAEAHGKAGAPLESLAGDEGLQAAIVAATAAAGKARGLKGFELPKGVILEPTPWTPDDLLTPTFKLKRADAQRRYQAQIDALYATIDTVGGRHVSQGAAIQH